MATKATVQCQIFNPGAGWLRFESLINIRPGQGNRSLAVQSPELRRRIERIVRGIFEEG